MNVAQMSSQAALMIAVIVIIRAVGMGRLPKWSFQALWGIALARLLVPFSIESPLSVYGAVSRVRVAFAPAASFAQASPPGASAAQYATAAYGFAAAQSQQIDMRVIVWLSGLALIAAYFLLSHFYGRRRYGCSRKISGLRVKGLRVEVRASHTIEAPLTYGVFRPVVLIPERVRADDNALSYVLEHEISHIRHFDTLKKWLLAAALCIHWFNPLVWVMYILANRDIELLCDESVVTRFGDATKAQYATMLIDLMESRAPAVPLMSHFSRNAIEERIVSIMKYKKVSFAAVALAMMLVFTTATALATSAVTQASQTEIVVMNNEGIDSQDESERYAPYAEYGLTYDADSGRLYFNGELVRYFEDLYSAGEGASTGIVSKHADGTVDVRAVREFPQSIELNAKGYYDTSGHLTGVEPYSQAEFDERTSSLEGEPDTALLFSKEDEVLEGDVITYTITVTNSADTPLQNVTIEGADLGNGVSVGDMEAGESLSYQITVHPDGTESEVTLVETTP